MKKIKFNKNDVVYTPRDISKKIVEYFKPTGKILDPCMGDGAFFNYFPQEAENYWCEIRKNKDFFKFNKKVDWIITNPPFSTYDDFLEKGFKIANNVVFLIPLYKTFKSKKQQILVDNYGGLKTIIVIGSGAELNFNMGFLCGCVHYKKGYNGLVKIDKFNK